MKSVVSALFLACIMLVGCMGKENPPPDDLIQEDTYIDLLIEMQLVKSYQERILPDSNVTDSLIPKIMEQYGITEGQFKRSHHYYQNQVSEQQERINEAIDRLHSDKYSREPSSESDGSDDNE